MRNKFFILLFVFVIGFSFTSTAFAGWFGFGGRIISVPATEIIAAQSAGYICPQAMLTFTIKPVSKTPISFTLIGIRKGFPISSGLQVLGLYSGATSIFCPHSSGIGSTVVTITNVLIYGTSR